MSDLAAWLQAQGFGQYAELFAGNAIDREALLELSDEHLKELGLPLGHRVKLLKAIRELREPEAGRSPTGTQTRLRRAAEAERRQLTVLFVDLVGSTALSARLDPEDMGAVIRAYHGACAEVVERWGGHVAKYMGDGVLAYFGWPQAHEDEAERAVRAGLVAVVERAGAGWRRRRATPLAARVGIATGLVMVGELIGEGAAQEQTVVGETPNLAARLQALAAPGSVVISQATRRLVGGLFELADLGPRRAQGLRRAARRPCGSKARAAPRGASRRCTASISRRWSGASTSSASCWSAGPGPGMATARWCCSRASPGSASRACSGPCASASATSRTRRSATTARRITPTARCIR